MTTYLGKSCSFGLLHVSYVNVSLSFCDFASLPFGFGTGMWDWIVLLQ